MSRSPSPPTGAQGAQGAPGSPARPDVAPATEDFSSSPSHSHSPSPTPTGSTGLTESQTAFLSECDQAFQWRFHPVKDTDLKHFNNANKVTPPTISPWYSGGGRGGGGGGGYRRDDRSSQHRGRDDSRPRDDRERGGYGDRDRSRDEDRRDHRSSNNGRRDRY